jgi:quercetin dioxygenase-like cupin family protein
VSNRASKDAIEKLKKNDAISRIPFGDGLRKVKRDDGERFDVAGAQFIWKVRGEDTGYAFSIYEQELRPGEGVPLHCHAYAEVFYLLSGSVDFLRVSETEEEWIACTADETIIIPINALHAFYNRTDKPARLLSISTQLHQAFFDAIEEADRAGSFSQVTTAPEAMVLVAELARRFDMHFFPFSPPKPR